MLATMSTGPHDRRPLSDAETAGLPAAIASDLLEASLCCTFGAYRAAGLLTRRAVEQVAVLRRVPRQMRTFNQKVAWLLEAGHIPVELAADARAVRELANAAAHGVEAVSSHEAWTGVRSGLAVARGVLLR